MPLVVTSSAVDGVTASPPFDVTGGGYASIVVENCLAEVSTCWYVVGLELAVIVKEYEPAVLGVPDSVLPEKEVPGGTVPDVWEYEIAFVAENVTDMANVWVYASSGLAVTHTGAARTVIENDLADPDKLPFKPETLGVMEYVNVPAADGVPLNAPLAFEDTPFMEVAEYVTVV